MHVTNSRTAVRSLRRGGLAAASTAAILTALAFPGVAAQAAEPSPNAEALAQLELQAKQIEVQGKALELKQKQVTALSSSIPDSGMTPEATLGEKGGNSEGYLLASRAMRAAGADIANAIGERKKLLIAPSTADLQLSHWRAFQLRVRLVRGELVAANAAYAAIAAPKSPTKGVAAMGMPLIGLAQAGDAIAAVAKIGSFFGSKYTLKGENFTTSEDMLASAIAQSLLAKWGSNDVTPEASTPKPVGNATGCAMSFPVKLGYGNSGIRILKLTNDPNAVAYFDCELAPLQAINAAALNNLGAAQAAKLAGISARLKAATDAYAALLDDLTTADDKGAAMIELVAQERVIEASNAQGAYVLVAQPYGMNGGVYSQTNLWTWVGASLPFKASGSAVAGYRLTDSQGLLIATGVVDRQTPYTAINRIR